MNKIRFFSLLLLTAFVLSSTDVFARSNDDNYRFIKRVNRRVAHLERAQAKERKKAAQERKKADEEREKDAKEMAELRCEFATLKKAVICVLEKEEQQRVAEAIALIQENMPDDQVMEALKHEHAESSN